MGKYAGVWYDPTKLVPDEKNPRGLELCSCEVKELAKAAPGAPVMWDHSAINAIQTSQPGKERAAAADHPLRVGTVEASWVDERGIARIVWSIFAQYSRVANLVERGVLTGLSATHVVDTNRFVELSLTSSPARPGCVIDGIVTDVSEYIKLHPPW